MIDLLSATAVILAGGLATVANISARNAHRRADALLDLCRQAAIVEARVEAAKACKDAGKVVWRKLHGAMKGELSDVRETNRRELANQTERLNRINQGMDGLAAAVNGMVRTSGLGIFAPDLGDDAEAN